MRFMLQICSCRAIIMHWESRVRWHYRQGLGLLRAIMLRQALFLCCCSAFSSRNSLMLQHVSKRTWAYGLHGQEPFDWQQSFSHLTLFLGCNCLFICAQIGKAHNVGTFGVILAATEVCCCCDCAVSQKSALHCHQ